MMFFLGDGGMGGGEIDGRASGDIAFKNWL